MSTKLLQAEPKEPELRILLIGKTGAGRTSAMNVLLGRPALTKLSASSQTTGCRIEDGEYEGQKLVVIDTPGLMNTDKDEAGVKKDIVGCIAAAAPGPHVFLLVVNAGALTAQDKATVEIIHTMFGDDFKKYTLALFTRGDEYVPTDEDVQELFLKDYIAGFHSFDNTGETRPDQVSQLLDKINAMVGKNEPKHYTSAMLREVQEVKEREMEKSKGDGPKEQVLNKVVESILSNVVGEPLAGLMLIVVGSVIKKVGEYVTK